jgi:hypothetical protein
MAGRSVEDIVKVAETLDFKIVTDPDGQLILYTGVYSDFAKAVANTSKALDEHDGVEREDEFGQRV